MDERNSAESIKKEPPLTGGRDNRFRLSIREDEKKAEFITLKIKFVKIMFIKNQTGETPPDEITTGGNETAPKKENEDLEEETPKEKEEDLGEI